MQAQEEPSRDRLLRLLRRADSADWFVRIVAADSSVDGRILDVARDSVRFPSGEIAVADVAALARRHKEGGGATIGAIAGGAALGLFLLALAGGLCEYDCDDVYLAGAAGLALGGTLGGLIGAVVAPGEDFWEELWRDSQ